MSRRQRRRAQARDKKARSAPEVMDPPIEQAEPSLADAHPSIEPEVLAQDMGPAASAPEPEPTAAPVPMAMESSYPEPGPEESLAAATTPYDPQQDLPQDDGRGPDLSAGPAVLVTGGSGFIGRELTRALVAAERSVVAMYHHRLPEALDGVFPVCSDMGSAELLAAPLRGVDTVVHLAWEGGLIGPKESGGWDPNKAATLPRNVVILRNLIRAMERAGTRRLVFVSAIGASRQARVPFLMEKYLAEYFVLNSNIPEKVVVRSSVVWGGAGEQDRFLNSVRRVVKFPIYPVPRKEDGLAPLHVRDLAKVLLQLIDSPLVEPTGLIEINGGTAYKVEDLFKMVSQHYGKGSGLALKGMLGDSLLPLFDRESGADGRIPKLSHFLALGTETSSAVKTNPTLGPEIDPDGVKPFAELLKEVVVTEAGKPQGAGPTAAVDAESPPSS